MTDNVQEWYKAQDQLRLLKYYDVPIIDGKPHPEMEPKPHKRNYKHHKEHNKNRNSFLGFLKRCLYFKPKTFIGATLLAAVLTTISGGVITSCFQNGYSKHRNRPPKQVRVENAQVTNTVAKAEVQKISQAVQQIYTLYQYGQNWLVLNEGNMLTCVGCGDKVQEAKTQSGKDVQMTCITCQKPFLAVFAQATKQEELTRQN